MANLFREKLASGKRMLGTHINLFDSRVCEMLGAVGFDYLWVDMEHISTTFHDMEADLIAAKAANTPVVVRVTWNDIPHIKRVIEAGPDAILVPMVNTVEEAKFAIDTCIYPLEGRRGFGPCRAIRYGLDSAKEYVETRNKEMCRFVQVETKQAVEVMEETSKIPYLDGYVIGPMDLSGSVGALPCPLESKETDRLIRLAIQKAHDAGKPIGLSTGSDNPEELEYWMSLGVDFLSASTDMWSVLKGGMELLSTMRSLSAKHPRTPEETV